MESALALSSPPSVQSSPAAATTASASNSTSAPAPPLMPSLLSCAKALSLLSSLKSDQIEKQAAEAGKVKEEVDDLRKELVRERVKGRAARVRSTAEVALLVFTFLSFLTLCFVIAAV